MCIYIYISIYVDIARINAVLFLVFCFVDIRLLVVMTDLWYKFPLFIALSPFENYFDVAFRDLSCAGVTTLEQHWKKLASDKVSI